MCRRKQFFLNSFNQIDRKNRQKSALGQTFVYKYTLQLRIVKVLRLCVVLVIFGINLEA